MKKAKQEIKLMNYIIRLKKQEHRIRKRKYKKSNGDVKTFRYVLSRDI